jgi:carboxypeptidase C (cathepsin A)
MNLEKQHDMTQVSLADVAGVWIRPLEWLRWLQNILCFVSTPNILWSQELYNLIHKGVSGEDCCLFISELQLFQYSLGSPSKQYHTQTIHSYCYPQIL